MQFRPDLAKVVSIDPDTFQFDVDGKKFPWHISEAGPTARRVMEDLYAVHVEMFLFGDFNREKDSERGLSGFSNHPVIDGEPFPWWITEDGFTYTVKRGQVPMLTLSFLTRKVEGIEPVDDDSAVDKTWSSTGHLIQRLFETTA